jgi:thymidylate synthase
MVNAWNVGELDQMVLPPCHYGFQVYTRELSLAERRDWVIKNRSLEMPKFFDRLGWQGKVLDVVEKFNAPTRAISLMWNQRSVDTFLGLPFNIASYGLLLEIIAKEVNMVPDELIGNLGDCHLYLNHLEQAKDQVTREEFDLPKLGMDYREGEYNKNLTDFVPDDFYLINYQSHPSIKAPLNN